MKEYIERSLAENQCEPFSETRAKIHNLPAADVAPIRHGKWIIDPYAEKCGDAYCSECNHFDWSNKKYCSECGAKMDGGNSNDR